MKDVLVKLVFEHVEADGRKSIQGMYRAPLMPLEQVCKESMEMPVEFINYTRQHFGYGKDFRFNIFLEEENFKSATKLIEGLTARTFGCVTLDARELAAKNIELQNDLGNLKINLAVIKKIAVKSYHLQKELKNIKSSNAYKFTQWVQKYFYDWL